MNLPEGFIILNKTLDVRKAFDLVGSISKTNWDGKHRMNPHHDLPEFRKIIDMVVPLLGISRPIVTHSKVSLKTREDQVWLPHQDRAYKGEQANGYTIAVFLEDVGENDGAIEVFPGSHKHQFHHERILELGPYFNQLVITNPPSNSRMVTGGAGTVLIFDLGMVHQSGRNNGKGTRAIFIFEVQELRHYQLEDDGRTPLLYCKPKLWERISARIEYAPKWLRRKLVVYRHFINTDKAPSPYFKPR